MHKKNELNVVIERDAEGFFIASVPTLEECHTQANSLAVFMKKIRDAMEVCLEVTKNSFYEPSYFIGTQRVAI